MRLRTDDAARRFEHVASDLPGDARWSQWLRGFYLTGALLIPICGGAVMVMSILGASPLLHLAAVSLGVVTTLTIVVTALTRAGRYDTPATPLRYRRWQLMQELIAPDPVPTWRPQERTWGRTPTPAKFGPAVFTSARAATRFRSRCAEPTCPADNGRR